MVANTYGEMLAELLPDVIPGNVTRLIAAFLALFIGVRLLIMLLSMMLNILIKTSGLGAVHHGLGVVFGLALGLVIVLAVVLVCGVTAILQQPVVARCDAKFLCGNRCTRHRAVFARSFRKPFEVLNLLSWIARVFTSNPLSCDELFIV